MTLTLPDVLQTPDDSEAVGLLREYFGPSFGEVGYWTGSSWDAWDSAGTRTADADRFTADDLVAVTMLSVEVPPQAAHALLVSDADRFAGLLAAVGADRDLVAVDEQITAEWPASKLYWAVKSLPGLGQTTTSKLLARKRPRLLPIWDSVIGVLTGTRDSFWEPLRLSLRYQDQELHRRLLRLRDAAALDESVSALRVFDVLAWMEGKRKF